MFVIAFSSPSRKTDLHNENYMRNEAFVHAVLIAIPSSHDYATRGNDRSKSVRSEVVYSEKNKALETDWFQELYKGREW